MTTATKTYAVTGWMLDYKDDKSDKVYNVFAFADGALVLHYGRRFTTGQTKVDKYTPDEAQIIAKRQVYAKAGKGYKMRAEEFQFSVDEDVYRYAVERGYGGNTVTEALRVALLDNEFTQRQSLVARHYDTFIEQTNQVLDAASKGEGFEELLDRWQKLEAAWAELDNKHQHAATAVSLVKQVVSQRLLS